MLKKLEHNRFNIIFENAGAVVYHINDIFVFLSEHASMNKLQTSVLSDLKDDIVFQEILVLAVLGKIVTGPFLRLVDSKTVATHILDLNQYFLQLQINLKHWSKDPNDLLSSDTNLFPEFPPLKDEIFNSIFASSELTDENDVIIESSSLL